MVGEGGEAGSFGYIIKGTWGIKFMRPKNGPFSVLERENGARLYKRLYLFCLDTKFYVLYLAHYYSKYIVNTPLSAYILLDFCVRVFNFGRQASQARRIFNILLTSYYVPENLLCNLIFTFIMGVGWLSPTL